MFNHHAVDILNSSTSTDYTAITSISRDSIIFLLDPTRTDLQERLAETMDTSRFKIYEVKVISESLLSFFNTAISEGYSIKTIEERCKEAGLNHSVSSVVVQAWKEKLVDITSVLLSEATTNRRLIDMDWSFGVTAASDDISNVGKTFLQLKLILERDASTEGCDVIFMELSLEQFYQLLASMEKCKAYIDYSVE